MNTFARLATCLGLSSAVVMPMPETVRAQTTDAVFVHGAMQSGHEWQFIVPDLEANHPLLGYAPTLTSDQTYDVQATQLAQRLSTTYPGQSDVAAITHSNGGVVLRKYLQNTSSPVVDRHLSLGSPHRGAYLAQAILDGTLPYWALNLAWEITSTVGWFAFNDDIDWPTLWFGGTPGPIIELLSSDFYDFLVLGLPLAFKDELGFLAVSKFGGPTTALVAQMSPFSSTFAQLNSSASLAAEAAALSGGRVSISTSFEPSLAPYMAVTGNQSFGRFKALAWENVRQDLAIFAYDAYFYYLGHANPQLSGNAYKWWDLWFALSLIPSDWEYFVGSGGLGQHDGIVPWVSSAHPGSTANYELPYVQTWVHHYEQQDDVPNHNNDTFRILMSNAIDADLGIEFPPPPPPPLASSISGPTSVRPGEACAWSAVTSGGLGPYSYQWSGVLSGSASQFLGSVPQSGWLNLTVTSADQQQASSQVYVSVSGSAPECVF